MPDHVLNVGNTQIVSLLDCDMIVDPVETFPDSTSSNWREEYPELLNETGMMPMPIGSVAVRTASKLVVIDTGLQELDVGGPIASEDGRLLEDMKRKGVDREAVDLVLMSHLHPDHVGWNLTDGSPTFPKARYLVPRVDWEFWAQPEDGEVADFIREQVLPLGNLRILDLVEGGESITDQITAVATPGHTPGHTSYLISSSGEKVMVMGDVTHSPAQAHYTDWSTTYDTDTAQALETRRRLFDELEADGSLVSACHYPQSGFGRFVRRDGRRTWETL